LLTAKYVQSPPWIGMWELQEMDYWDCTFFDCVRRAVYHDFPWSVLPELFQKVDLHAVGHTWWCSITYLLAVWIFLNILEHWIQWDGSIAQPSHSFDLNSVDFYVWRHLKSVVYVVCLKSKCTDFPMYKLAT
jgi:hypothetical protein